MAVRIRPALPRDALAIAEVDVESWSWAYPGLLPQPYLDGLSIERRARRWATVLGATQSRALTWIASDEQGCCGFASAGPVRPEVPWVGELYTLYVSARALGRGVGQRLLVYAVAQLKAMLYESAVLWVLEQNERARRFYERQGWSLTPSRGREWIGGTHVDVVQYERAL